MKYSFKIGSVWKIPIELHLTFILLIAAVFFLAYPMLYPFFLVLLLFVFVFFHELAHSVIARHYGIKVRKIILYPIGGVSEIEEIPDKPSQEWRMAVAGPLTNLLLGGALLGIGLLISPDLIGNLSASTVTGNFIIDLAMLNIILGAFNLIPAFPMDGGRVFRALLAEYVKYADATRYAVYLGRILGIVMIIAGFIFPLYFLLVLVGIFVYIGASEEEEQTIISTKLAGIRVKDVMRTDIGTVNPQQSIAETLEVMFKNRYHDALVEKDGVFQGVVTWSELMKVNPEQRASLRVEQMPLKRSLFISPNDPILEANKIMNRERIDLIPVINQTEPTKIAGVVTSECISSLYEEAKNR
ncbi:MAG: site-2 protease family protein [Candidatus Bathyarchaeia archaeon]|jgi:Zn-dependent protease/CBS domain-containing protein